MSTIRELNHFLGLQIRQQELGIFIYLNVNMLKFL